MSIRKRRKTGERSVTVRNVRKEEERRRKKLEKY